MNLSGSELLESFQQWQRGLRIRRKGSKPEPLPLRAELYSAEQMEAHGARLGESHQLGVSSAGTKLLRRLHANELELQGVYALLTAALDDHQQITPSGEWLVDNFGLLEEQILIAKKHLPKGYHKGLPILSVGPSADLPRVYALSLEIISHGDGQVSESVLSRFIAAYQSTGGPLRLSELWAIPIMLRLALIENLRRVMAHTGLGRHARNQAKYWAEQMLDVAEREPRNLITVVADMARANVPLTPPFVAEMVRRLQGHSATLALPLSWIEQRLVEQGGSTVISIEANIHDQTAAQLSTSNTIGTLRNLDTWDWRDFVEGLSVVEATLRQDPSGTYPRMDFASRDQYRHRIEALARRSAGDEPQAAAAAIALASAAQQRGETAPADHVGHYLLGEGEDALEKALSLPPQRDIEWLTQRAPMTLYGGIALLLATLLAVAVQGWLAPVASDHSVQIALWALIAFCAWDVGLNLTHWLFSVWMTPRYLPRLDYQLGIDAQARTVLVVPTLITSSSGIKRLLYELEVRFHANRDAALSYVLLTDFGDADSETLPSDAALIAEAQQGIAQLNQRHGVEQFLLLHRPRQWNAKQGIWMAHERKRGKLADLNHLLLTGDASAFNHTAGTLSALQGTRYVITLDTDTELPRDAAREMVAAMEHPLHQPRFDDARNIVVSGYAILQPRVSSGLAGANGSRYAQFMGGEGGVDTYTGLVSSVYQDLFGEGSFVGKGIYHVAAFERALKGRLPDNRVLSHDLIESGYARAGLIADVEMVEDYPTQVLDDVSRHHRWVRGDWQVASWIIGRVRNAAGERVANPLNTITRWKLFDNLRRIFVAPAQLTLLLLGWLWSETPLAVTLAVVSLMALPPLCAALDALLRAPLLVRQHLHHLKLGLLRAGYELACLPFDSWWQLDATLRTLWRLNISGKYLLQWRASHAGGEQHDLRNIWRRMIVIPLTALVTSVACAWVSLDSLLVALPILLMWIAAPVLTWWLCLPRAAHLAAPASTDRAYLRALAWQTWRYFDKHVTAADHWLVPDNVQESPRAVVARRTSPTNVGLSLLANLSAHDFGYIGPFTLLRRTADTLASLMRLERHRGHLYNWYDTETLAPLLPRYVSSVDSGNFLGCLLALRTALLELPQASVLPEHWLQGLLDARTQRPVRTTLDDQLHLLNERGSARPVGDAATFAVEMSGFFAMADNDVRFLEQLNQLEHELRQAFPTFGADEQPGVARLGASLQETATRQSRAGACARDALALLDRCIADIDALLDVEHAFLYDKRKNALSIGFDIEGHRLDRNSYDLLASEARLASFLAIASGEVPQRSWFAMGRQLTPGTATPSLVSWSGTMFEYLMPMLLMPSYANSLLDHFSHAAVKQQIAYGAVRKVPWGISESGYNAVDASENYQYHAFGVPTLGVKKGLAEDLVIAPYATVMAAMFEPDEAVANLKRLESYGMRTPMGFYEALDFTPARVGRDGAPVPVRSFMAHHQAMSLLSIDALLHGHPMARRFAENAPVRATLRLLQERVPQARPPRSVRASTRREHLFESTGSSARSFATPHTPTPQVQLLSNGRYHVMVSNAGAGSSRWNNLMLTRWREDVTRDAWGAFVYLHDVERGLTWSTTYQPTCTVPDRYEASFSDTAAEFSRRDHEIDTQMEIVVSPEDDVELRRIRLTNRGSETRVLELTSYSEPVLTPLADDAAHPAFTKLFVQTELQPALEAVLATRRPRAGHEQHPTMLQLMCVRGEPVAAVSFETDRAAFIGRGRSLANPQALKKSGALGGSEGCVLDPVLAIRHRVRIPPGRTLTIDLVTGVARDREGALALVNKYRDPRMADRIHDLAWTQNQVSLRQLAISDREAQLYQQMAGHVVYASNRLRAPPGVIARNQRGQSGLWGYSISGDLPLVLVKIRHIDNIGIVRQMVNAHAYWKSRGLAVDLLIWNEDHAGYRQQLNDAINAMIALPHDRQPDERGGRIHLRSIEHMPMEDMLLQQAVARLIVSDADGSLPEQINRRQLDEHDGPLFVPTRKPESGAYRGIDAKLSKPVLLDNGRGGFSADGSEYVIPTDAQRRTPLPWCNVLANPHFGTVVSESGSGYTWAENAHEIRLTPWANDPVSDPSGEALYLRDEETGQYWSPTPLPCDGLMPYVTRHGFGYTVYEHLNRGIRSELWVYVALDASVKFSVLKLSNLSDRPRKISVTSYVQWLMGDRSEKCAPHLVTELDAETGAIFARNAYTPDLGGKVAFCHLSGLQRSVTGDRAEFIGRNGEMRRPAAMRRARLSGRLGAALDPCGGIRTHTDLAVGQTQQVVFLLGLGSDTTHARGIVKLFQGAIAAQNALARVRNHWADVLGRVQVQSQDPAFDVLANGWLLYQTIACRLWARSGYYQSGGAFGFRDQLQDCLALVHNAPHLLRNQLLLCASRQFVEGDVQHWWHPPAGRGVRTRCSDDFLWLPLGTARYVMATRDTGVLDESVAFLEARQLALHQESDYDLPRLSGESGSLYEHCRRALQRVTFGVQGLPLMGAGDWNDGMNLVGIEGRGESVWLAFFYARTLRDFAPVARLRGDIEFADWCARTEANVRASVEANAWDGEWYRRATFDDGTPMGSAANVECRIDSIAQSWSVLSDNRTTPRAAKAMQSLDAHLVRRDAGLIQLLHPPFDGKGSDPGYIRGYPPGVRENGGQYTHAAIWATMAFAQMGDAPRAWSLAAMINPLQRGVDLAASDTYKGEPYVVAADIYGITPHTGRSGWTWYTGSAGWMYRLMIESLLGLQREGGELRIAPLWREQAQTCRVQYRYGHSRLQLSIQFDPTAIGTTMKAVDLAVSGTLLTLLDDGAEHTVEVVVGRPE